MLTVLLLVVIYALGPTPETPVYTVDLPAVPSQLSKLERYVLERENRPDIKTDNNAKIIWANETLREKTDYVLLYLHGFSASLADLSTDILLGIFYSLALVRFGRPYLSYGCSSLSKSLFVYS